MASLFNSKAKKWVNGRKNWHKNLLEQTKGLTNVYWFHCASMGEFEQGAPLMEALKKKDANITILVTFFSPSGYETRKNTPLADVVCYLPIDNKKNATQFITALDLKRAFFIKYEFWYFYFNELQKQGIPLYMVSATFRKDQIFFKSYGKWYLNMLQIPETIFVQDEASKNLLKEYNIPSVHTGDTRFDKVIENAKKAQPISNIETFKQDDLLLVAGSSWEKEEELLAQISDNTFKLILAPHDISESHIKGIEKRFPSAVRYSNYTNQKTNVLIIDNIGMLSNLYQYADIAFVGGGYKNALHNILEPATFGVPVFYGPNNEKYPEAKDMKRNGAGYEIENTNDLVSTISRFLNNTDVLAQAKKRNKAFIELRSGATDAILKYIK